MTVIAAYNGTASFVFGADSMVTYGDTRMLTCEDKFRVVHNWIVGLSGDCDACVEVEFKPEIFKTDSIKTVTKGIKEAVGETGEDKDFEALLANVKTGEMFFVDSNCYPQPVPAGNFWAAGVGRPIALGAMAAISLPVSKEDMQKVIEACCTYSPLCGGNAVVKTFRKA